MSLIFRHKLVHDIFKHYKFIELRPMHSNTLVCFKIFHFIKFTFQNSNRCIWNRLCEKNKPGRGANFIVRPRAQNSLATPLNITIQGGYVVIPLQYNYSGWVRGSSSAISLFTCAQFVALASYLDYASKWPLNITVSVFI